MSGQHPTTRLASWLGLLVMSESDANEGEILKASAPGPQQISVGMEVVSLDGQPIGRVKELRNDEFLLDRRMARDLWVPISFVLATEAEGTLARRAW